MVSMGLHVGGTEVVAVAAIRVSPTEPTLRVGVEIVLA